MSVRKHTVKQGESLSSIAKIYDFNQINTIYKHPLNDAFRSKRSNPEEIFPGDEIYIPEKEIKSEGIMTQMDNVITIKSEKRYLNLVLYDFFDNGVALANCPYQLKTSKKVHEGYFDGEGKLSVEISKKETQAELRFEVEDRTGVSVYNWTLDIAHLDPVETPSGIAQRLENIGYLDIDMDDFYSKSNLSANLYQLDIAWKAFAFSVGEAINWHSFEDEQQAILSENKFSVKSRNKNEHLTTSKQAQELLNKYGLC